MATLKWAPQNQTQSDRAANHLFRDKHNPIPELAGQAIFLDMLRRERRRTERSGRPFLLVLIGTAKHRGRAADFPVRRIAMTLSACVRECDFLGWFEHPNTLGILMTELGSLCAEVIDAVVRRIENALRNALSPEVFYRLSLKVRVFPDDAEDPVFTMDPSQAKLEARIDSAMKRVIDIVGSLGAIIILSPVFLVIALLVKCTSKGPVLFHRMRLGHYGREFSFFKFRTMYDNNDPDIHKDYVSKLIAGRADVKQTNGLYKLTADPRITPLGQFLRRTSLDELPQFFNVLFNDMSLVGPRPPLPYEYKHYNTWHKRRVLEQKPGITGLWQVEGRSRTTFDEMVRIDIRYARTRNLLLDLKIILRTPAAMISGQGAC